MLLCLLLCLTNDSMKKEEQFLLIPKERKLNEYEDNLIHKILDNNVYTISKIKYDKSVSVFKKYYDLLFLEYIVNETTIKCYNLYLYKDLSNQTIGLFLIFDNVLKKNVNSEDELQYTTSDIFFNICSELKESNKTIDDVCRVFYEKYKVIIDDIFLQIESREELEYTQINRCEQRKAIFYSSSSPMQHYNGDVLLRTTIDAINNKQITFINKFANGIGNYYGMDIYVSYVNKLAFNINNAYCDDLNANIKKESEKKSCGYNSKYFPYNTMFVPATHIVKNTFVDTSDYIYDKHNISPYDNALSYDDSKTIAESISVDNLLDSSIDDVIYSYISYAIAFFNITDKRTDVIKKLDAIIDKNKNSNKNTSYNEMLKIILKNSTSDASILNFITTYTDRKDDSTQFNIDSLCALFVRMIISNGRTGDVFKPYYKESKQYYKNMVVSALNKDAEDVNFDFDTNNNSIVKIKYDGFERYLFMPMRSPSLCNNFMFMGDNKDGVSTEYICMPSDMKINFPLKITHDIKKNTYIVFANGNEKLDGYYSNNSICAIFDKYRLTYLLFESNISYTICLPYILSPRKNIFYMSYKNNECSIFDGDIKYIIGTYTKLGNFCANRWIYGIPLSFVVYNEQTRTQYIVLVDHQYHSDHFEHVGTQWKNIKAATFESKHNDEYYVIEISKNNLDLYFSDPTGKDIYYYVYCCIFFQKADCLRSVYNKYLSTNIGNYKKFDNPFHHYFSSGTDMEQYFQRLDSGAYNKKYSMNIEDSKGKIIVKNWTFKVNKNINICDKLKKMCDIHNIIEQYPVIKTKTNLKNTHLVLFRKEISSFFKNYKLCKFIDAKLVSDCISKFKSLHEEHKKNIAKLEDKIVSESHLDIVSFIENNTDLLYDIMTYNLFEKFIKDINTEDIKDVEDIRDIKNIKKLDCLELKRMYDFVNHKIIYDGPRTIDIIVFEILFGAYIRDEQYQIYRHIVDEINKKGSNYSVYQLLMGRGKTAVIMPLVALYFLLHDNHYKNIILVTPDNLTKQTHKAFVKYFSCVFSTNKIIYYGGEKRKQKKNKKLS